MRPDGPVLGAVTAALLKIGYRQFDDSTGRFAMFLIADRPLVTLQIGPALRLGGALLQLEAHDVDMGAFFAVFEF